MSQLKTFPTIKEIGSNNDPCFGKNYNLNSSECQICGDSELCAIKLSQLQGKTRKQLEESQNFKDMDILVDIKSVRKFIISQIRKGISKKEIISQTIEKFSVTKQEARFFYKKYSQSKSLKK